MSIRRQGVTIELLLCLAGALGWLDRASLQNQPQNQAINAAQAHANSNADDNKPTKSFGQRLSIVWGRTWEDPVAFYTFVLSIFTGLLFIVSTAQIFFLIRADKTARMAAIAAQKQAVISAAAEGSMPLLAGIKLVQYEQIPGETNITDPVPPGPIPANCRILLAIENKGRSPLKLIDLCVEKFIGNSLPARSVYTPALPWGLILEKGPLWIRLPDEKGYVTPADVGAAMAVYPQGALWVFGFFTYWNLLDERVEHKFLYRWDQQQGFVPENRIGYT